MSQNTVVFRAFFIGSNSFSAIEYAAQKIFTLGIYNGACYSSTN